MVEIVVGKFIVRSKISISDIGKLNPWKRKSYGTPPLPQTLIYLLNRGESEDEIGHDSTLSKLTF
jgi:hypothetical protein